MPKTEGPVTVAQAWDDYHEIVIPQNAGPLQVRECKRAFYAGAESLMVTISHGLSEALEVRQEDVEHLVALQAELMAFARDVGEGRE